MLRSQTDPTTNQAERTCFMAQIAATSSFRIKEAWTLGCPSHWCAGFNTKAKEFYSSTDLLLLRSELVYGLWKANSIFESPNWDLMIDWRPYKLIRFFQQESGFMLQQVTITTPGKTRCISTDISIPRKTLVKVTILEQLEKKFEWEPEALNISISKGKSRRWKFTMSHWTKPRYKHR